MARAKIKWRRKGFPESRRLPGVGAVLERKARQIADACGGEEVGFYVATSQGKSRDRAAVIAGSPRARRRNARDNTLVNNLMRGRG